MPDTIPRYPLQWPAGWKRMPATARTRARFAKQTSTSQTWSDGRTTTWRGKREVTIAEGVERVRSELARMGIPDHDVVISTDLQLRLDGLPRSGQREPEDPGVAVYWLDPVDRAAPKCMAVDRYDRVADNLAAVAATLEAMRAIERHGGAEILQRAFVGFAALPAPGSTEHWADVLDRADPEGSYRRLRSKHHPDRAGGDAAAFQRVQRAYEAWQRERGAGP